MTRVLLSVSPFIRNAKRSEVEVLSQIAWVAKSVWHYPEEYMERWREELTITKEYVSENIVRVFVDEFIVRAHCCPVNLVG